MSTNTIQDWSRKTNFFDIPSIGYLCDDGEVISGDVLRQNNNKIFVHFNTDSGHYGKKYEWIQVPNDRICPPPPNRPRYRINTLPIQPTYTTMNESTTDEDQDLARAIAASLGQTTYNAPSIYNYNNYGVFRTQKPYKKEELDTHPVTISAQEAEYLVSGYMRINCKDCIVPKVIVGLCEKWYFNQSLVESFIKQPELTYDTVLDIFLNEDCCAGVYDFKAKQWRPAVYMNHWDKNKRIMVRYTMETDNLNPSAGSDKFCTLKIFPINCIQIDKERFKASERDLRDMSNVPRHLIDAWLKREKEKKSSNTNSMDRNDFNNDWNDEDELLQQAIAASLQEQ